MISKSTSGSSRFSTRRFSSRLSAITSENERARVMASLYADKENQPFESTRVSSANLLHEQVMSSQMETDDDMMDTGNGEEEQSTLVGRNSDPSAILTDSSQQSMQQNRSDSEF